jgi:hypothetical protein
MARDLVLGLTPRSFALGSLPEGAEGYAPTKWVKMTEAELLVNKLMNPTGFLASRLGKLTREQAEKKVLDELRAQKVGIMSGMGLDLGALVVNRLRGRPDDAPLVGPGTKPLGMEWSQGERRALKLLEPSTAAHVVDVVSWARNQGIPAKLSSVSVIYTPEDSARHYAEGRSGIAPGRLDWHQVGRAYHLVIPKKNDLPNRDAYAYIARYARQRGGEWLGDKTIITPRGPVQDLAHYEYHPGTDIASYRKSALATTELRRAQARARRYG